MMTLEQRSDRLGALVIPDSVHDYQITYHGFKKSTLDTKSRFEGTKDYVMMLLMMIMMMRGSHTVISDRPVRFLWLWRAVLLSLPMYICIIDACMHSYIHVYRTYMHIHMICTTYEDSNSYSTPTVATLNKTNRPLTVIISSVPSILSLQVLVGIQISPFYHARSAVHNRQSTLRFDGCRRNSICPDCGIDGLCLWDRDGCWQSFQITIDLVQAARRSL